MKTVYASKQKPPVNKAPETITPATEFAPTERVLLPIDLFEFNYHADQLTNAIRDAGAQVDLVAADHEPRDGVPPATVVADHTNIWLRDYSPIPVKSENGRIGYRGFLYESPDQANNDFGKNLSQAQNLDFRPTTIDLEGGNFLTDGTNCYIAGPIEGTPDGSTVIPTVSQTKTALGCRDLIVIERPPHVHIDMFAKILDAHTVAVNQLSPELLDLTRDQDGEIPELIEELRNSLEAAAEQFSHYLKVVRIPMPLPYKNTFRTYTNAILVNQTAIVPDFKRYGWEYEPYPDQIYLETLRKQAEAVYKTAGFKVVFVNADGLIFNGGAFHCVTMHIPRGVLTISQKGIH